MLNVSQLLGSVEVLVMIYFTLGDHERLLLGVIRELLALPRRLCFHLCKFVCLLAGLNKNY